MDNSETQQSILNVAGENYEYLRTIINNKLEIKKLEMISKGASVGSSIIVVLGILLLLLLILQLVVALAIFALYNWTESLSSALLIMIGALGFFTIMLYLLRRPLIQSFLERKIEHNFRSTR